MKKKLEIELDEKDVYLAILEYVKKHQGLEVVKMIIRSEVRGNYDQGTAQVDIERVICECDIITD